MPIRILVTGGTFDKEYNELIGTLSFKHTYVEHMLERGRCKLDVTVEVLMMKDSLEMTDADRTHIVQACLHCDEQRVVITHGTDTMVETAQAIAAGVPNKTVVLTGRWCLCIRQLRRPLQPRKRLVVRAGAAARGLRGDEWPLLRVNRVRKNRALGIFERDVEG